jgi:hypothetical protein
VLPPHRPGRLRELVGRYLYKAIARAQRRLGTTEK